MLENATLSVDFPTLCWGMNIIPKFVAANEETDDRV